MSFFAGCDFSSRAVDVVLVDEDTGHAEWRRYELTGGPTAFDRTRSVRGAMGGQPGMSFWEDVVACGIEEPRGPGNGALLRVQGAILACLPTSLLVEPFTPSQWRKAIGLKGNASKFDVAAWATWDGGLGQKGVFWPQDACDAYCLALAVQSCVKEGAAA